MMNMDEIMMEVLEGNAISLKELDMDIAAWQSRHSVRYGSKSSKPPKWKYESFAKQPERAAQADKRLMRVGFDCGFQETSAYKNVGYADSRAKAAEKAYSRAEIKRIAREEINFELSGAWMKPIMARMPKDLKLYPFDGEEWNAMFPL
jgi:hypothetical protein